MTPNHVLRADFPAGPLFPTSPSQMTKLTRATSKFWVAGGSSAAQQELMLGLDDDDGWLQVRLGGRGERGSQRQTMPGLDNDDGWLQVRLGATGGVTASSGNGIERVGGLQTYTPA